MCRVAYQRIGGSWRLRVTSARELTGVRMYDRKAEDRQRPMVCMRESGRSACAADVAAPIQKLCPVNRSRFGTRPAKVSLTDDIRKVRVSGLPSWWINRGPCSGGRIAMYANTAARTQIPPSALPK